MEDYSLMVVKESTLTKTAAMAEVREFRIIDTAGNSESILKENIILPAAQTTEMAEAIALAEGYADDAEAARDASIAKVGAEVVDVHGPSTANAASQQIVTSAYAKAVEMIAPTAAIPSPIIPLGTTKTYEFNADGNCLWIESTVFVSKGGKVDVTRNENLTYTRTYVPPKFNKRSGEIIGCLNYSALSTQAKAAVDALLSIEVVIKDDLYDASNIRLYGMWNGTIQPTTTIVVRNYTTGSHAILARTNGVNTGIIELSGQPSDGSFTVKAKINLDALPVNFDYYQDSAIDAIKLSVKKLSTSVSKRSTVLTIASSYALPWQKDRADYICDGANDEAEINTAIQSFPILTGGKIHLTGGRFNISNTILIDRRIAIEGDGSGLCLYKNGETEGVITEGVTTLRAVANVDVITITGQESTVSGVLLRDFIIQGYGRVVSTKCGIKTTKRTDVLRIDNVNITECYCGMHLYEADACNVTNSSFQWCSLGIYVNVMLYFNLIGCTIADNIGVETYDGHFVDSGGLVVNSGTCGIVSSNRFVRCDRIDKGETTFVPRNAISALNCSYLHINDNLFVRNNGNCIGLLGLFEGTGGALSATARQTKISDNNFADNGDENNADNKRNGVYIKGANVTQITGNMFTKSLAKNSTDIIKPLNAVYEDPTTMASWWGWTHVASNHIVNHHSLIADRISLVNANSTKEYNKAIDLN